MARLSHIESSPPPFSPQTTDAAPDGKIAQIVHEDIQNNFQNISPHKEQEDQMGWNNRVENSSNEKKTGSSDINHDDEEFPFIPKCSVAQELAEREITLNRRRLPSAYVFGSLQQYARTALENSPGESTPGRGARPRSYTFDSSANIILRTNRATGNSLDRSSTQPEYSGNSDFEGLCISQAVRLGNTERQSDDMDTTSVVLDSSPTMLTLSDSNLVDLGEKPFSVAHEMEQEEPGVSLGGWNKLGADGETSVVSGVDKKPQDQESTRALAIAHEKVAEIIYGAETPEKPTSDLDSKLHDSKSCHVGHKWLHDGTLKEAIGKKNLTPSLSAQAWSIVVAGSSQSDLDEDEVNFKANKSVRDSCDGCMQENPELLQQLHEVLASFGKSGFSEQAVHLARLRKLFDQNQRYKENASFLRGAAAGGDAVYREWKAEKVRAKEISAQRLRLLRAVSVTIVLVLVASLDVVKGTILFVSMVLILRSAENFT